MVEIDIDIAVSTDVGGRSENEDSYEIIVLDGETFVILADGLGAHGEGKLASTIAVSSIKNYLLNRSCSLALRLDYEELINIANENICDAQRESQAFSQMRTTIAVLHLYEDKAVWMHCGDTRIYHIRDRRVNSVTIDHSVSQMAVSDGLISREELPKHVDRNRLTRSLGGSEFEAKIRLSAASQIVKSGDRFLLCTDGWWEYMDEKGLLVKPFDGDVTQWLDLLLPASVNVNNHDADNRTAVGVFVL